MVAVTFTGWILALHLLSAFALIGALTLLTISFVAARRIDDVAAARALSRVALPARIIYGIGMAGTIVFGLWMVFRISRYSLTNGWIVAAIVLWVVVGALSGRALTVYRQATTPILEPDTGETAGTAHTAGAFEAAGTADATGEVPGAYRKPALLALDAVAAAIAIAILAVMIWKPGA